MDPLSILLDGARARDAFVLRTIQTSPWSVQVRDGAPLNFVAILRGTPWVVPSSADEVRLDAGDIAIMRGPDAFTFADDPGTPIQVVVQPGPRRTTPAGAEPPEVADTGVRTWANGTRTGDDGADGSSVLLIGKYRRPGEIATRLLSALPPLLVIPRAAHGESALVSLLAEETVRDEPGQDLVLERLLDLLLVATLRAWFIRPDADAPPWYRANGDRARPATHTQPPGLSLDSGRASRADRGVPSDVSPPLHRPRRHATNGIPHPVANRPGRRSPQELGHHD